MDFKQRDLLKGFYAHCYAANHNDGFLDAGFWMEQLDAAKIPWFIQNQVAHISTKRESISLYFNTLLNDIVEEWNSYTNESQHRYILRAPNGAYYTGQSGLYSCSFDIESALLMSNEKAQFLKGTNNHFLNFEVLELPQIKVSKEINHFNDSETFLLMTFDGEEVSDYYNTLDEAQSEYKRLLHAA